MQSKELEKKSIINELEELNEFYEDNNGELEYDWDDIVSSFPLSESFIRTNFSNLNKVLLLKNQVFSINFILEYIRYFEIDDVVEYQHIENEEFISLMKQYKETDSIEDEASMDKVELDNEVYIDEVEVEDELELEDDNSIDKVEDEIEDELELEGESSIDKVELENNIINNIEYVEEKIEKIDVKREDSLELNSDSKLSLSEIQLMSFEAIDDLKTDIVLEKRIKMYLSKAYVKRYESLESSYFTTLSKLYENIDEDILSKDILSKDII